MVANDPIHQWQGKWWFYDETWANQVGPFDTEEAARHACDKYCEELNYDAEPKIDHFSGRYKFLSNFFMANVVHDKVLYPSVEHAYQAAKTKNKKDREKIRLAPTAGIAKKLGKSVTLRQNWERDKKRIMYGLLKKKFHPGSALSLQLKNTGSELLVKGNYWHDNYWGDCICNRCEKIKGKNVLGKLLMRIRKEI